MNIVSAIEQALPLAIRVIPAIAAGEIALSGFIRAARGQIGVQKLSSELAAAALYGLASLTPIPYMSAVATTIFVGYSLFTGGSEDAYISSKLIYKPCELTVTKVLVPLNDYIIVPIIEHVIAPIVEKVVVPVAKKVAQLVKFVWEFVGNTITKIVTKIGEIIKPILEVIHHYVIKPAAKLAGKIINAVWDIGESIVRNVLKPIADLIWAIVRPVLRFIGSALARLAFIPETFFNNPRWTVFAILAVASVAVV